MQVVEDNVKSASKIQSLTCAEIGLLMSSYVFGSNTLQMTSNLIYLGTLLLFDLYEHQLIDLYFRLDDTSISLKSTSPAMFPLLEKLNHRELALSLSIVPLVKKAPKSLPDVHQNVYKELLKMSCLFDEPSPILCHDFLVCCKTQMFLNMQMNEARAWLIVELAEKNLITYERKFLIFFDYFLTESGQEYSTYLADQLSQQLQGGYMKKTSDFPKFDCETNQRNTYVVSQLLINTQYSNLKKCAKVTNVTYDRAKQRQIAIGDQIGALLRKPELKLQPENQESWFVAMVTAMGLCMEEAMSTVAAYM
ncbi:Conserved_hypothetical protein [Hexamita inflata]|uniref:Uncharacterized protein n=1 Tax=Hexamita inflata TaxID=28002 RepID=A0ABP1H8J9_9EUKA